MSPIRTHWTASKWFIELASLAVVIAALWVVVEAAALITGAR